MFSCSKCNKTFSSKQAIAGHMAHHSKKFKNSFVAISDSFRKKYDENPKRCITCGEKIPYEKRSCKFCNSSCAAKTNNQRRRKPNFCLNCESLIKPTRDKRYNKYCNKNCFNRHQFDEYIKKWKNDEITGTIKSGASHKLKRYFIERHGEKCMKCGWKERHPITNKVPVVLHHIDGNHTNNKEINLELICPNCHSLTPNYKALNTGNGRTYRRKDGARAQS